MIVGSNTLLLYNRLSQVDVLGTFLLLIFENNKEKELFFLGGGSLILKVICDESLVCNKFFFSRVVCISSQKLSFLSF